MTRSEFDEVVKLLKAQEPEECLARGVFLNRIQAPRYELVTKDKRGRAWKRKVMLREVWPMKEVDGHPAVNPEYVTAPFQMTVRYLKNVYTAAVQKKMNAKLRILGKVKI